jgi:hypothetical protein
MPISPAPLGRNFDRLVDMATRVGAFSRLVLLLIAFQPSAVVAQAPEPDLILETLLQTAQDFPQAWVRAHTSAPEKYDFIVLAIRRLYAVTNGAVRGNWRRGDVGDLSMDGISVRVGSEWRFADVIAGAGGSNPRIVYATPGREAALRNRAGKYIGEAGTVKPEGEPGVYPPLTTRGRYRRLREISAFRVLTGHSVGSEDKRPPALAAFESFCARGCENGITSTTSSKQNGGSGSRLIFTVRESPTSLTIPKACSL